MKKILSSKIVPVGAALFASYASFAQEATSGVTSSLVTPFITDAKAQVLAVLTAGAVIVGAFFVWGLIKRALNRSK